MPTQTQREKITTSFRSSPMMSMSRIRLDPSKKWENRKHRGENDVGKNGGSSPPRIFVTRNQRTWTRRHSGVQLIFFFW
ncbi:hypothetical protein SLEP1_g49580 [Rubroshorea leprosula]|uniref:Uncharacterized protein n=1 Tax=Rubroshorea leprosula TaxID=152421 RepID=A0AAV5LXA4_9ROSI|nr:hypothetical protein SLEP1_g49580 [Rubroshorea leprosula]